MKVAGRFPKDLRAAGFAASLRRLATTWARKAALTLGVVITAPCAAEASTLGGPLLLQDEGIFYANVRLQPLARDQTGGAEPDSVNETMVASRAYVHFRIPLSVTGLPVVMIGGSGDTGASYETTPDGREGWATYFTRQGFPTYVVDGPGRGRAGFNSSVFVEAKAANDPTLIPDLGSSSIERHWPGLRLGPRYPAVWANSQFPTDAMEQFAAQFVPNAESTYGQPEVARRLTIDALIAVLEKTGPAILIVHSQSGLYGLTVAAERPDLVKALIATEGSCAPTTALEIATYPKEAAEVELRSVPFLAIFGDHAEAFPDGWNGVSRREACRETVARVQAAGGPATFWHLPALGIQGNSHAMALERNNLTIADMIIGWIHGSLRG